MFPPMWPRPTNPIFALFFMSVLSFDRLEVVVGQLEVGGVDDRVDLVGSAKADDRAVDGSIGKRPGDGDGADARAMAICHGAEALDDCEVFGEARLLEARVVL